MTDTVFAIDGTTSLLGILADPIAQVKTPEEMNLFLRRYAINSIMLPFHVDSKNLAVVVDGLRKIKNLVGFIVTIPHKIAMTSLCDSLSVTAQRVGAVNVVRCTESGLYGDLTDGEVL